MRIWHRLHRLWRPLHPLATSAAAHATLITALATCSAMHMPISVSALLQRRRLRAVIVLAWSVFMGRWH